MRIQKYANRQKQSGQSLVEFAISMIIILLLLLGTIDFGVALFKWVTMRDAAQEGAVYGSVNPTDQTGIRNRAIAAASDILTLAPGDITINFSCNACEGSTGTAPNKKPNTIQVSITHSHPVSTPLIGTLIGSQNITLSAQVTNTILSPVCP